MSVALDLYRSDPYPSDLYPCPSPAAPARPRLRAVPDSGPQPAPLRGPRTAPRPERQAARAANAGLARLRAPAGVEHVAPLRLTRRGVAVLTLLVAAVGGALVWWAAASAPAATGQPRVPAAVTVRSGDTLWSIADRYAGSRDPLAVVDAIRQRNHLAGVALVPGQVLRLR